ncbi:cell division protein FtsQ/DivIB [Oceanicaulis sp. MMSF_3324]|uniref:cell division protein FtsQ/DivIB n=1 Tax=Oceanicaulis sp. MMSF_3324 TaxID=3046702 RepID=UPI00273DB725|nr:cell division protein FtsQ/DivIB [Oceanicaulis sp. MMSF_3324]
MSKLKAAGARDTSKARRKSKTAPKAAGGRKLSNWAAAQWRAARYRAGYAFKLILTVCGVLLAGTVVILTVFGQIDDVGGMMAGRAERELEQAGYTLDWLDVAGAERTGVEEIAMAVGAAPGLGLSRVDLVAARESIQSLSWVKSAEVLRLWPDRIAVLIEERQPYAVWQINQTHHVIDPDGYVIDAADPRDFLDLPRVVGEDANREAGAVIALLALHPEIRDRVTNAIRVGERRWNLRLQSGGDVLLPEDDPASALALLAAMHEERGVLDYEAQIFDLRNAGEMVMRPWPDRAAERAGRGA